MKAKEKGATLIHVDPRFTRTSALCDVYVGIRAGSDIAFLGGLVNYVLSNERWFKEYVLDYTNAATIIEEGFQDTEDLAGLFSGYRRQREDGPIRRQGRPLGLRRLAQRTTDRRNAAAREGARPGTWDSRPGAHGRARALGRRGHDGTEAATAARPDLAASALRVADPQAPLRPLHAGDGVAGVRLHAGGTGPRGGTAVCQLRPRTDQRHRLRRRLDAAHHRRADHPHRRHPATAARQHGPARRRHHGDARPFHHPGLDRHRHPVRSAARLFAAAGRRRRARDARFLRRARRACRPATGPTSASSSSACSRPGTATRPRRRTTSASPGCRASTAIIRNWPTSTAWRRAR